MHKPIKEMKLGTKFLLLLSLVLLLQACKSSQSASIVSANTIINNGCLMFHPSAHRGVRFNPGWIMGKNIETIVEREYLDG